MKSPRLLITFGLILMLLGIILPLLMILQIITATFAMCFFAYGSSVAGLALATIGVAYLVSTSKTH